MIRLEIRLEEQDYRAAKKLAQATGISLAEFVRRAVRLTLTADKKQPWMRHAGSLASGDRNSSQSIDAVVYGRKD